MFFYKMLLRDDLRRISVAFPKAIITVGHIPGETNPADTMTKIFRNPIKVINSDLYRYGSEKFAGEGCSGHGHVPGRGVHIPWASTQVAADDRARMRTVMSAMKRRSVH